MTEFIQRYITPNSENESDFYIEEQLFTSLVLAPGQKVEDFYNVLLDKAKLLSKSERERMSKFISGLPPMLAYFVRATSPKTATEALASARKGDAYGYRQTTAPVNPVAATHHLP